MSVLGLLKGIQRPILVTNYKALITKYQLFAFSGSLAHIVPLQNKIQARMSCGQQVFLNYRDLNVLVGHAACVLDSFMRNLMSLICYVTGYHHQDNYFSFTLWLVYQFQWKDEDLNVLICLFRP